MINGNNTDFMEEYVTNFIEGILNKLSVIYFELPYGKRILIDKIKSREVDNFEFFKYNEKSKYYEITDEIIKIRDDKIDMENFDNEKTIDVRNFINEIDNGNLNLVEDLVKLETISEMLEKVDNINEYN